MNCSQCDYNIDNLYYMHDEKVYCPMCMFLVIRSSKVGTRFDVRRFYKGEETLGSPKEN